jgi:hypothetical protein
MPLLRLASLIVATLLVAALSALIPPSRGPHETFSNQHHEPNSAALVTVAMHAPGQGWTGLQGAHPTIRYGRELARLSGQSVPGAGQ